MIGAWLTCHRGACAGVHRRAAYQASVEALMVLWQAIPLSDMLRLAHA